MERYISLFGKSFIECLVADREFVGCRWVGWLNDNRIRYHLCIRKNFWVHNPHNGKDFKAFWAFLGLVVGQSKILLSFNKPEEDVESYKTRWQIEACFKSLKSSVFNVEDTHLSDIQRIERLFVVLTIAFLWAYLVGIFKDRFIKQIRILNNGRRAFSFFKYGLDAFSFICLNPDKQSDMDIF